jgi:PST family polysaccharide transporter
VAPPAIPRGRARWTAAETAAGALLSLLASLLVARLIGPEAFGTAALAAAAVALAQPLVAHAFTNALVQRPGLSPADIATALRAGLGLAALVALPLAALGLAAPGALLLPPPGGAAAAGLLLAALCLALPLQAVEGVANGLLLRRHDARALALRGIAAQLAGLAAGLGLALAGAGPWAPVGQQLAFCAAAAGLAAWFARLALPGGGAGWSGASLRAMAPFALASAGSGLAQRLGPRLFLLAAAGGAPALAGLLQLAFRLAEQARDLPAPFVHRYALPTLSRLAGDRPAFLRRLAALSMLSGLVFAPAFAGLALCAAEVIALLLGPGWEGAAPPLAVMAAALALAAPRLPLGMAFTAAGLPGVNLRLTLGVLGVTLLLAPLVPRGQAMGAAAAWAAAMLAGALAAGVPARRRLGFGAARQAGVWAAALLPAAAVAAAVLGGQAAGLVPAASPAGALAAKIALGLAAGLPLIPLLGRRAWREAGAPVPAAGA